MYSLSQFNAIMYICKNEMQQSDSGCKTRKLQIKIENTKINRKKFCGLENSCYICKLKDKM